MKTNRLTKSVLDKFDVSGESETEFCDNYLCKNEATKTVPVSVRRAGDSERNFCEACYEAYVIGVQHGRIGENPRAYSRNGVGCAGSRKSKKLR